MKVDCGRRLRVFSTLRLRLRQVTMLWRCFRYTDTHIIIETEKINVGVCLSFYFSNVRFLKIMIIILLCLINHSSMGYTLTFHYCVKETSVAFDQKYTFSWIPPSWQLSLLQFCLEDPLNKKENSICSS